MSRPDLCKALRAASAELRSQPVLPGVDGEADAYEANLIANYLDRIVEDLKENPCWCTDSSDSSTSATPIARPPTTDAGGVGGRDYSATTTSDLRETRLEELLDDAQDRIVALEYVLACIENVVNRRDGRLAADTVAVVVNIIWNARRGITWEPPETASSSPGAPTPAEPLPVETRVLLAEASGEEARRRPARRQ